MKNFHLWPLRHTHTHAHTMLHTQAQPSSEREMLQRCGTLTIVSTAVAASSSDRIRAALAHYVVAI